LPKPQFFSENDRNRANDKLQTIYTVNVKPDLQPVYGYLVGRGSFVQLGELSPGDGVARAILLRRDCCPVTDTERSQHDFHCQRAKDESHYPDENGRALPTDHPQNRIRKKQ
jgi:hypothetical protein